MPSLGRVATASNSAYSNGDVSDKYGGHFTVRQGKEKEGRREGGKEGRREKKGRKEGERSEAVARL